MYLIYYCQHCYGTWEEKQLTWAVNHHDNLEAECPYCNHIDFTIYKVEIIRPVNRCKWYKFHDFPYKINVCENQEILKRAGIERAQGVVTGKARLGCLGKGFKNDCWESDKNENKM